LFKLIVLFTLFIFFAVAVSAFPDEPEEQASTASEDPPGFWDVFWAGLVRAPSWGRPFWADMRSTLIHAEGAYATNNAEYDWTGSGDKYRPYVFLNLGVDFPIWSHDFAGQRYGVSLSQPMSIYVWMDMFEHSTRPIIDTDYRVGVPELSFIHRLMELPRGGGGGGGEGICAIMYSGLPR
jgi:hypothetical protein